jgi:hypothetical protein
MRPSTALSLLGFAAALVTEILFGRAPGAATAPPGR